MAYHDSDIRPQTRALDTLIRETLARLRRGDTVAASDALLFLGNWHPAVPAMLVQDPVLEPVDKIVWMVIYQSGRGHGARALFPRYNDIARLANVSSSSTVSRAVAILRVTRWLSLCASIRSAGGRFGGNVYALHGEPLPLADAVHLDPGYMAFLQGAGGHHHARVRRVANAVSASLNESMNAGKEVAAPVSAIEGRIEAVHAVRQKGGRQYFNFSAASLSHFSNARIEPAPSDRHQNLQPAAVSTRPQNSKAVLRSSSINKKTTTTTQAHEIDAVPDAVGVDRLIFPVRLNDNQRALAVRYLTTIPAEHRQPVLDELSGRLQAEKHGAKPVYDELRYLHHLCVQVNRGGFHANLGLKVHGERERRRQDAARLREEAATRERERRERASRPPGANPFAEIRKMLGMPPSPGRGPR